MLGYLLSFASLQMFPFGRLLLVNQRFTCSGVAGGAASGKTTVCDMIIQQLHDQRVVVVNQVEILLISNKQS